jgi:DNA polymerase-1
MCCASTRSQAKQYGLVRTLLGRVRRLSDINSEDPAKAAYAERQAVNSVIQGTASDLIKYAMANVDRALCQRWPAHLPAPRLVMQIHDELIYEVSATDPGCLTELTALLHTAMEEEVVNKLRLGVPLVVNVHSGEEWGNIS